MILARNCSSTCESRNVQSCSVVQACSCACEGVVLVVPEFTRSAPPQSTAGKSGKRRCGDARADILYLCRIAGVQCNRSIRRGRRCFTHVFTVAVAVNAAVCVCKLHQREHTIILCYYWGQRGWRAATICNAVHANIHSRAPVVIHQHRMLPRLFRHCHVYQCLPALQL
jgi:hypothetical protein